MGSHVLLNLAQKGEQFKALKREYSSLEVCKNIFAHYKELDLFDKINVTLKSNEFEVLRGKGFVKY